jgi:hypothetical protein
LALVNENAEPMDGDLVTFGKHMGRTYAQVYLEDQAYCEWVMTTVAQSEGSPALLRLAHFIHTQQTAQTFAADGWAEMHQL